MERRILSRKQVYKMGVLAWDTGVGVLDVALVQLSQPLFSRAESSPPSPACPLTPRQGCLGASKPEPFTGSQAQLDSPLGVMLRGCHLEILTTP